MFSYEIKFLTGDNSLPLKNCDFKTLKYESKKRGEDTVYDVGKRSFCERRGGQSRVSRQIRQLESKLSDRAVVFCEWTSWKLVTLVFSTGAIAYLTVKPETLDVTQVLFDRYCVGKLSGQTVTGVVLSKSHLLLTHADRVATIVTFGRVTNSDQPTRIVDRDPHLQSVELGGARRAERKVSWSESSTGVRVLVWGASATEPAPWSPVIEDLANLHLYQLHGQQVMLIAHHQLENETLSAELSHNCDNVVHIVEQLASNKNGVTLHWTRYEIQTSDKTIKLSSQPESVTKVSLPSPVRVTVRSPCGRKLLAACIDGSLHVLHQAGNKHSHRAGHIVTDVRWANDVIIAAEEAGRLQCYDKALQLLHQHTKCIDLTAYSRENRRLQMLSNTTMKGGPLVLATFAGGPMFLLRIIHPRLLTGWIRAGKMTNAVNLLQTLDWETEGTEGLWAINKLVCESLRNGMQNGAGETTAQAALGAFLSPLVPLGPAAHRFAPPVHDLARKFFHHLLRRGRIEKALSLAVDLCDWDLFCDARHAATGRALTRLADEAHELAMAHATLRDSECSESCSQCSSHSSESDNETSASSEAFRTKPPPLPRLPPPEDPTIMPVMTNIEPGSTGSIRPNLHQYLERDTSIWNIDAKDNVLNSNQPISNIKNLSKDNNILMINSTAFNQTVLNQHSDIRRNSKDNIINNITTSNQQVLNPNIKWHSMDNFLTNYNKRISNPIDGNTNTNTSITRMKWPDRMYKPVYEEQVTLRQELPNNFYRYHTSINYVPSTSGFRYEEVPERPPRLSEKTKVKFADTVTITVVPESPTSPDYPSPSRELADSLPLTPPHAYLAAFTPQRARSRDTGTKSIDYVEV